MTFYGTTATAAGIVVPKKYLDAGRRRRLQEASDRRRPLQVRQQQAGHRGRARGLSRLLAARAERQDAGHAQRARSDDAGADGEDRRGRHRLCARRRPTPRASRRDPRLQVVASKHASIFWIEFTEQWDPKSPWHDKRLRLAVNYALDRKGINEAACLGFCPPAGVIVPRVMEFALQVEPPPYDPAEGQAAARRGRLSERDRRRRVRRDPGLPDGGRGGGERSERGRHPRQAAADGARGVLRRPGRRRSCAALFMAARRQLRQRREPGRSRSSSPRAPTPMAAIPTSTSCSCSRRASATPRSARRCSTRSSS